MKKHILFYITLFFLVSCNNITDVNVNPKKAKDGEVLSATLFSNAQNNLVEAMTTPNVNENIFRLLAQQWTETTYTDESNYDLATRNIPQNFWNLLYRDVLRDLQEARKLLLEENFLDATVATNQQALITIMETYTCMVLVNTYGDIPYSEALDIDNPTPAYDDGMSIYEDLLAKVDAALTSIDVSADNYGVADLIYQGNLEMWIKFANSLKLKLGMMLADVDPAKAKEIVEAAAPNIFTSNAENATFIFSSAPPHSNPIWENLVQSGRHDFVVANTIVDMMNNLEDPRRDLYFTNKIEGVYKGGVYGASSGFSSHSQPSETIQKPTFEGLLIDYAELEFCLAEAVERGMNVEGTAEEHYNKAITASMEYWGAKDEDIATYLARADVAYMTASDNYKEKIGVQKWLALFNRGHEAWTEQRRLDYPVLNEAAKPIGSYPLRYTYPVQEQNLNVKNYNSASSAIGGDVVTTKLFWDKF